jgi:methionyl-tRNA formyltransferase
VPRAILLLTGEIEAPYLAQRLRRSNRRLEITAATDRASLDRALAETGPDTRLIAFCTPVIVPAAALEALGRPAYNFHPGPPEFPGRQPARHALYAGAARFGATVHEMAVRVDAGPIVAVEDWPIAPDADGPRLDAEAYQALLRMFSRLADQLAIDDAPLQASGHQWGHRRWSGRDIERLQEVAGDIEAEEMERRIRAFGDLEPSPLYTVIAGRRFRWEPPAG